MLFVIARKFVFFAAMALQIASLNSGSNGNCYYIGNDEDAVLIDAGISCREIERRMAERQLSLSKVKAIFISHEHSDHIRGLAKLANKYRLPVYITDKTALRGPFLIKHLSQSFCAEEKIQIGSLCITAFSKKHDADDPHSFIISHNGVTVGVITDIGTACEQVVKYFRQCHAVFLESNYDEDMLLNGRYPYYLKTRISSDVGHLSNSQALELFLNHRPAFMSHVFLSHLSKDNNSPEIAAAMFAEHAGDVNVVVASRYEASEVYTIFGGETIVQKTITTHRPVQLGLFDLG